MKRLMLRSAFVLATVLSWVVSATALPLVGSSPLNVTTISASGSSQTVTAQLVAPAIYNVTLTGNTVFTLSGGTAGLEQTIRLYLHQDATAGRTPSFSGTVHWLGNITPTFNSSFGLFDEVDLKTIDGGTNWAGVAATFPDAAVVPGVPTGVTATAGNTQILINAGAQPGLPAVTGYTIYRGTSPGGESGTAIATNTSLPYNDTGLTNTTAYYYKIAAVNSSGTGVQSAEVTATPTVDAYGPHYAVASSGDFYTLHGSGSYDPGTSQFTLAFLGAPTTSTPAGVEKMAGIWGPSSSGDSASRYMIYLNTNGTIGCNYMYAAGVSLAGGGSTVAPAWQTKVPLWVRCDINSGAGTIVFYTAPYSATYAAAVWTQLGSVVSVPTGTVNSSGGDDMVSLQGNGGGMQWTGDVYAQYVAIPGGTTTCMVVTSGSSYTDLCGSKTYTFSGGAFAGLDRAGPTRFASLLRPANDNLIVTPRPPVLRRSRDDLAVLARLVP